MQLGHIRGVPGPEPGRPRVPGSEIDRLRAAEGFPGALRERVRTVGTAEGAALLAIPASRFTRLARAGLLVPVRFYLNRYRAVVWLYLADELREFAPSHGALLTGAAPEAIRRRLEAGEDLRARNWRGRRRGLLARQAGDAWEHAAVTASMLDPEQVSDAVPDPYERAYLRRIGPRPYLAPGPPDALATQVAVGILFADDPDEIHWLHTTLAQDLEEARKQRPAPRPREISPLPPAATPPPPVPPLPDAPAAQGPRGWLRRRRRRRASAG
ncbi:DUF6397 family protein [Streptomyces sp. O3]